LSLASVKFESFYLCPEFARSKASLCGSGLFVGASGEWDDDGEKGCCAIPGYILLLL